MLISTFERSSRFSSALLVSCISRVDFISLAATGSTEFLGGALQAIIETGRQAEHVGDEGHHVVDLIDDPRTELIDAFGSPHRRKIGFVDLFEVGIAQRAVARQRLINDPAEGYFFITMLPTCTLWTSRKALNSQV
ncbi:hypothetical protein GGQ85_000333 [Nitrobacter vulgaris]|nr:hypothetical protein [Nitrobacter vulgaris]